jgi:hypothetical protein
MITMAGTFLVNGMRVDLPDSVGAQMGFQRAPSLETTTPFATVSDNTGHTLGARHGTGTATACDSLQARAQAYPGPDPLPAIRRALVIKCEAEQRAGATATGAPVDEPTGYPDPAAPKGGLDTKTKIAIGAGVVLVALIAAKKLRKR